MRFFTEYLKLFHIPIFLKNNCLAGLNRDTTGQYGVRNNNTIVLQIDFA